jgi:hypothetical protein
MSQFDFPRINFHGKILLDTPTANNGKFSPLMIYNEPVSLPFQPPRVYLNPTQATYVGANFKNLTIVTDSTGTYVPILPVNTGNLFNQWAILPLGASPLDTAYHPLYAYIPRTDAPPGNPLAGNIPGYWNYFGDLSVTLQDVRVTGVQLPNPAGKVQTWTPSDQTGCPPILAAMLGANLSFNSDLTDPNSRSTAVFCDVDPEGQTCTQIFYGQAGIVNNGKVFFKGSPAKSTANWMNLSKVINWSDPSLIPMGGSAVFYSTIALENCDPALQQLLNQYAGAPVDHLFIKLHIHRVHEVRNPDYSKMPTDPVGSNNTNVPKNPAQAYVTGSVCAWKSGDMTGNSIARILKNRNVVNIITSNIPAPIPKNQTKPVNVPDKINLGPAFLNYNVNLNLVSLDMISAISEYGTTFGITPAYAGTGDVPFFTAFESYNFGKFDLYFQKDGSPLAVLVGSFDFTNNYNMQKMIAAGGLIDLNPVFSPMVSQGNFYISVNNVKIFEEDEVYVSSDQQGTYATQNQVPANLYMNDGLPKIPITLRAFYRGQAIPKSLPKPITMQTISLVNETVSNQTINVYDGMPFAYDVSQSGCTCFGMATENSDLLANDFSNLFWYFANTFMITNRVLPENKLLQNYISGLQPITWDIVYKSIFTNYHTILPIMNVVMPFTEANWSDPNWLARVLMVIDERNWNTPRYMPVTRELSDYQRTLLQMWAAKFVTAS